MVFDAHKCVNVGKNSHLLRLNGILITSEGRSMKKCQHEGGNLFTFVERNGMYARKKECSNSLVIQLNINNVKFMNYQTHS